MSFDGKTYNPAFDENRLKNLLEKVYVLMSDGKWRSLQEIRVVTGGSEGGISARLRDLRKEDFGGYVVHKRRRGNPENGLFEYQLITPLNAHGFKCVFEEFGQGRFL